MTAFSERQQEDSKEDHEKYDIITYSNKHGYQKIELREDSYQINNLNQAHHHTHGEQYPHSISD
jgi:hypothetical protein